MTLESDSSNIIKDSGSSTITHVDIKGGKAAEVAVNVLTLSYKTYSVIFVLIYFFSFCFSFPIIF